MALGNKEVMAKNIRKYMQIKDVNQTTMCNDLGFKFMTLSDWLHAKTYPRIDKIEKMANYFGITKADLVEDPSAVPSPAPTTLTTDEQGLIEDYRELNNLGKEKVHEYIDDLVVNIKYTVKGETLQDFAAG